MPVSVTKESKVTVKIGDTVHQLTEQEAVELCAMLVKLFPQANPITVTVPKHDWDRLPAEETWTRPYIVPFHGDLPPVKRGQYQPPDVWLGDVSPVIAANGEQL